MRGHKFKAPRQPIPKAMVAARQSPRRSLIELPHYGECVVEFHSRRNGRVNVRVFQRSRLLAG